MEEITDPTVPSPTTLLNTAQAAYRQGAQNDAYHLALEITQLDPRNVEAWLLRAQTTRGLEESLNCLSRIIALNPQHTAAQVALHQSLHRFLEDDAFLAYVSESSATYYIGTNTGLVLTVPKKHAVIEPYPPREPSPLRPAYRRLSLALFGLAFAGLGTLLFAPLTIMSALQAGKRARTRADRIRALIVVGTALLLIGLAIPLTVIFLMHL